MAGVVIKVDQITPDLRRLNGRLGAMKPLLTQIGHYVSRVAVQKSFDDQKSPDNKDWAELKKKTIAARRGKHKLKRKPKPFSGKILVNTGRLKSSITSEVRGKDTVVVGTNVVYAARHQFGFVGVRGAKGFARGKNPTPARPYLFDKAGNLSKEADAEIAALVDDFFLEK